MNADSHALDETEQAAPDPISGDRACHRVFEEHTGSELRVTVNSA